MSVRRSRRSKSEFDYKIYHTSGVKIPIVRDSDKMADEDRLKEKKLEELLIHDDIQYIFDTNVAEDMDSIELMEVLEEISRLNKDYRHIHVELKSMMGTE